MRTAVLGFALIAHATALAQPGEPAPQGTDLFPPNTNRRAADLFRIAACGNDGAVPERFPRQTIDAHCAGMKALYKQHRGWWVAKAGQFIAKLRPTSLPTTVVYPFGGGDLSSALAVFPDATEITTISLEAVGDLSAVDTIDPDQLATDLKYVAMGIRRLYAAAHSTTEVLQEAAQAKLPGTLVYALAGLSLHDMEPVRVRYIRIEPGGGLSYVSAVSGSIEIEFRPRGKPDAPLRTYRHLHADLSNTKLDSKSGLLAHLRAKGRVAVMTKAASFLLWRDDFSHIRNYLLEHADWMISDATGIPPRIAREAGFEQVTYGAFSGPYFTRDPKNVRAEMIKLWKDQPLRQLPFRFGYPDKQQQNHMLVMQRAPK